jgi:Xaa-Pro aminopeptidase
MRPTLTALLFCAITFAPAQAAPPWKVTPAPPESWQRDRVADLTAHRKGAALEIGTAGVLILYAAEARNYAADIEYPFRQENDFYYLTGFPQEGSALVLIPGAAKYQEILFIPPSNPAQENWTGHILTAAEARKISGIETVWDMRQLSAFLMMLLPGAKEVFATQPAAGHGAGHGAAIPPPPSLPEDASQAVQSVAQAIAKGEGQVHLLSKGRPAEYHREAELAAKLAALTPPIQVKDAAPIFSALRRIKSQRELDLLQHALDITTEAFQRAYALALPGTAEYEIQAQFEFTFLRRNAHWGYPCIVASGVNATTLHYDTNQDTMKSGDLLLIDDAAEFGGYSVDVTRTIPVNGKFSKEQADIYRLVWEAQQAAFKQALPGHTYTGGPDSVHGAAMEVFKSGLFKLGLITDPNSDQQVKIWFNHGISHGIGLNVHDPDGKELQPGMAITVEPGLYFRPNALETLPKTPENEKFAAAVRPAFEKYKGIGVRIEDDVLITAGQPKVISSVIPSRLEDVEANIAQLRKAVKSAPLP